MENARPHEFAESSALDSVDFKVERNRTRALTPRQQRLLDALAAASDWVSREAIDRITGASNGPQIVLELRRKYGQEAIEMQQVESTDRDGRACKPGRYRLSPIGRQRIAQHG